MSKTTTTSTATTTITESISSSNMNDQQQESNGSTNNNNNIKEEDADETSRINSDENDNKSNNNSLWSMARSQLNHVLLTVNCVANIPMYAMLFWQAVYWTSIVYAPNKLARSLLLLYAPYCFLDPRPVLGKSGFSYRQIEWFRSLRLLKCVATYFPITLHKTVDLPEYYDDDDETENKKEDKETTTTQSTESSSSEQQQDDKERRRRAYLFLYHPHGVISMGANVALSTNGCDFDKVFPGIRRHGVTLNASFCSPIFREWMLMLGFVSANKETLTNQLQHQKKSVVLIPGGAVEALHAHESLFRLHIQQRKGFIKLCRETNAAAVPCLGFGENAAFDTYCPAAAHTNPKAAAQPKSSKVLLRQLSDTLTGKNNTVDSSSQQQPHSLMTDILYAMQQQFYRICTFSFPLLTKIVPNRHPIRVVVGAPIQFDVKKTVDECHQQYVTALQQLYDDHKEQFGAVNLELELI